MIAQNEPVRGWVQGWSSFYYPTLPVRPKMTEDVHTNVPQGPVRGAGLFPTASGNPPSFGVWLFFFLLRTAGPPSRPGGGVVEQLITKCALGAICIL